MTGRVPSRKTVFISYAHENETVRNQVRGLAQWLSAQGCAVWSDHAYEVRPPERGWITWMEDCIRDADVILIICTPRLKDRWDKREDPGVGHGATFEGAIVTQYMYDHAMRNDRFFPVLSDGGSYDDIPVKLRPWWNQHCFPSGNGRILRLICDEPAGNGAAASDWAIGDAHRKLTARLLADPGAQLLLNALRAEITDQLNVRPAPGRPQEIVDWFADVVLTDEALPTLFDIVHAAAVSLDTPPGRDQAVGNRAEEAAAALYCLSAFRLVDRAAHRQGDYVLHVTPTEPVIYGIITAALFGGALILEPSQQGGLPQSACVYRVHVPAVSQDPGADFERALYYAVFKNDPRVQDVIESDGPLTPDQRADLLVTLRKLKSVRKKALAVVIHGHIDGEPHHRFALDHKVPVLLPDETAEVLLRIDPVLLKQHIKQFWVDLHGHQGAS